MESAFDMDLTAQIVWYKKINAFHLAIKTGRTADVIITIGVHVRDVPIKTS